MGGVKRVISGGRMFRKEGKDTRYREDVMIGERRTNGKTGEKRRTQRSVSLLVLFWK